MAKTAAQIIVELIDKASGPAREIAKAMREIQGPKAVQGAKKLDDAQKALGRSMAPVTARFGQQATAAARISQAYQAASAPARRLVAINRELAQSARVVTVAVERQTRAEGRRNVVRERAVERTERRVRRNRAAVARDGGAGAGLGAARRGRRPMGAGIGIEDTGPIAGAVGAYEAAEAYKKAAAFDRRLTMIGQTADASRGEIDRLGTSIHDLAQQTATPVDKLAGGMEALVAQGRDLKESLEFMPSVAKTAAASGAEVDDIAKSADSVASNFGIAGKEMQKAFDIMAAGGKAGQFELKDMSRYLPSLAPAAKAAGFASEKGLADIVAMLQVIRKGTGSAEEAATSMTNVFTKLESDETVKNFKAMGVDLEAAMKKGRKEGRNLVEVLEEATAKATKGDLSLIPKLFKDQEYARGMRALMTYRGEWQKLSTTLQTVSGGTVFRDLQRVVVDSQAGLDRLDNSWQRFTQSLSRTADAGGVSKGLGDSAKEFEQIARALERINDAYQKGGLKGAVDTLLGDSAEGQRKNRLEQLGIREKTEQGRVAELEAANTAERKKLKDQGYGDDFIDRTMKVRERELEKARARLKKVEATTKEVSQAGAPKTPPSMLTDPSTSQISGQPGAIGQGAGSNMGRAFNEAFPINIGQKHNAITNPPLPPQRPAGLPQGIDRIEDILGPKKIEVDKSQLDAVKPAAEGAKAALDPLNGTFTPNVDGSSIKSALADARALNAELGKSAGLASGAASAVTRSASAARAAVASLDRSKQTSMTSSPV